MQTVEILVLTAVALVLVGGLVALGVGHRRWSIGTVVAGFLVLLAAATYLYLSARLAARDRAWAAKMDDYRIRIAKAADDQTLDADGLLVPEDRGPQSLDRLRAERDRWRRGRDRVDTWRGRVWQGATFQPPKDDTATGRVELAAEGNAENRPPIEAGSHVFLFDAIPFEDGGAYIGEFLVQSAAYDQETKRHVLTVAQTAPRDAYDTKVLARPHDSVTVFEDLPVDRWLAFYRSRRVAGEAEDAVAPLPVPVKEDAAAVRELLGSDADVATLVDRFVKTFEQHDEDVPKDEWEAVATEAAEHPGTLWATVEFRKPHQFAADEGGPEPGAAAAEPAAGGPKRDFEPGDRTEFDLQTAIELRDQEAVTIERIVRRRPLADALTLLHGSKAVDGGAPEAGVRADGVSTLLRLLQAELAALERSNERLRVSRQAAAANEQDEQRVAAELARDLESWRRDAREATALAAGFERELDETTRALKAAEAAIVERGRELTALMTRVTREIDRLAPPPERRAARP
jgi:hypothetical protein